MSEIINLVGEKYGKLLVISLAERPKRIKGKGTYWNCICDCGNSCVVDSHSMRRGLTKSCGCLRNESLKLGRAKMNLIGERFGKLTIFELDHMVCDLKYFKCLCDCGNENYIIVQYPKLKSGKVTSCGCDKVNTGDEKPRNTRYSYNELISCIINFVNKNGKYPKTLDFCPENNLPAYESCYKKRVGKNIPDILEKCGYVLTEDELYRMNAYSLGINISKEEAIEKILNMQKKLNRPLMYDDFRNPDNLNINIWVVNKYWGSMNKMKMDLGLDIIQESMVDKHVSIEKIKQSIIFICEKVFESEKRLILVKNDFIEYGCGLSVQTYRNLFLKNNENFRKFIQSLGFDLIKPGNGYNHLFDDGEISSSIFEYEFSRILRSNGLKYNIDYLRNVKYNTFIESYDNLMDCDYVIDVSNTKIYIEIAGMISDKKNKYYNNIDMNSKSKNNYSEKLRLKEKMMKDNSLNYIIYIPNRNKYMRELKQIVENLKTITKTEEESSE